MNKILAIYGSPRRKGNTTLLLDHAVQGALDKGARVEKIATGENEQMIVSIDKFLARIERKAIRKG